MKSGQGILGLLAGVAIGVTLGMLFAPDKGSSTRNKISKKSSNLAGEANEVVKGFLNEFVKKYENAKDGVSSLAGNGLAKETTSGGMHSKASSAYKD